VERSIQTSFGQLQANWANELTGQDFVERELSSVSNLQRVSVGIVDTGFDDQILKDFGISRNSAMTDKQDSHGTGVLATMMSRTHQADISALFSWEEMQNPERVRQKLNALGDQVPKVINISFSLGNLDSVHESFKILAEKGILLVASAGNGGDRELDFNNQRFPGILVGSVSPTGVASDYSQGGRELDILAPADHFLLTSYGSQGAGLAQGTSFSAPQVSALLADLLSVLPGLKAEEAEMILKKTAIKTIQSDSGEHGAGVMNSLKAIAVAKRLRESGWPLNRTRIADDDSLFDFRAEAQAASVSMSGNSEENLRKSFYLHPDDQIRKRLVEIYERRGQTPMALFFRSLTQSKSEQRAYLNETMMRNDLPSSQRLALARALHHRQGAQESLNQIIAAGGELFASPRGALTLPPPDQLLTLLPKLPERESLLAAAYLLEQSKAQTKPQSGLLSAQRLIQKQLDQAGERDRLLLTYRSARPFERQALLQLLSRSQRELVLKTWIQENRELVTAELLTSALQADVQESEDPTDRELPPYVVRVLFDEPRALQSFVRNTYFAKNEEEKKLLWAQLARILEEWNLTAEKDREQILLQALTRLTKEQNQNPLLARSALEALKTLNKTGRN
jgi:hypothetical protein